MMYIPGIFYMQIHPMSVMAKNVWISNFRIDVCMGYRGREVGAIRPLRSVSVSGRIWILPKNIDYIYYYSFPLS